MRRGLALALSLGLLFGIATHAHADATNEAEARALFREGNRLRGEKDYKGALDMFRAAYAKLPNPKILLNMGATLADLGRNAEAGDTYEKYLGDPAADESKRAEVQKALVRLDALIVRIEIHSTVPAGTVDLDGRSIGASPMDRVVRADPGEHQVSLTRAGKDPILARISGKAGEIVRAVLEEAPAEPEPELGPTPTPDEPVSDARPPGDDTVSSQVPAPPDPTLHAKRRSGRRLGVALLVHVDGNELGRGAAPVVAATFSLNQRLELAAGAILGKVKGIYTAAGFRLTTGSLRPVLVAGVPIFFLDGARIAAHAGLRLEWWPSRRIGVFAEAAVEYFPSLPDGYEQTVFVPAFGVKGEL